MAKAAAQKTARPSFKKHTQETYMFTDQLFEFGKAAETPQSGSSEGDSRLLPFDEPLA